MIRNHEVSNAVRTERSRLLEFIRRRVKSDEDAEDILQDVFYQLTSTVSVTEPIEQMSAWLFRVARNRIIDWYRKRKPVRLNDTRIEADDEPPMSREDLLFDPDSGPETAFLRSMIWEELEEALDELPEAQRFVFVRHELEGQNFKEMALETGEPINTLISRKRYAVLFLRERLLDLYNDIQIS